MALRMVFMMLDGCGRGLGGCAAAHVIAMVATAVVVAGQPAAGFALQLAD